MKKSAIQRFLYSMDMDVFIRIIDATDCIPTPPQFLKTRSGGTIIVFQTSSLLKTMGVVVGWVVSKPRPVSGQNSMSVRVRPLTLEERRKYARRFKKVLNGRIEYWRED